MRSKQYMKMVHACRTAAFLFLGLSLFPVSATAESGRDVGGAYALIKQHADKTAFRLALTAETLPVVWQVCTQDNVETLLRALPDTSEKLASYGLVPEIDRSETDEAVLLFAWGPDLDELVEELRPDWGYSSMHQWIRIEYLVWPQSVEIVCKFDTLFGDNDEANSAMGIITDVISDKAGSLGEGRYHIAPMLYQEPDNREYWLYETSDGVERLSVKRGGSRVDLRYVRRITR